MDSAIIGPATLAVTQAVAAFSTFLPPFTNVRRVHPDDDPSFAADVRMGELASGVVTVGVGVVASSLTGSPVPAYVSVFMTLVLCGLYEYTLRAREPMQSPRASHIVNLADIREGNSRA